MLLQKFRCISRKYPSLATHLYHVVIITVTFKDFLKPMKLMNSVVFTGIFTAPVTGVYHFTFFYHAGGQHASVLTLFKNREMVAIASDHQTGSDGADNGGNAVVLQLQQGDQVYVSMRANSHIWAADYHTSFSGFLLS